MAEDEFCERDKGDDRDQYHINVAFFYRLLGRGALLLPNVSTGTHLRLDGATQASLMPMLGWTDRIVSSFGSCPVERVCF